MSPMGVRSNVNNKSAVLVKLGVLSHTYIMSWAQAEIDIWHDHRLQESLLVSEAARHGDPRSNQTQTALYGQSYIFVVVKLHYDHLLSLSGSQCKYSPLRTFLLRRPNTKLCNASVSFDVNTISLNDTDPTFWLEAVTVAGTVQGELLKRLICSDARYCWSTC